MPTYPYAQPIGGLTEILVKLRKNFPDTVDSSTLKRLGIAKNNESYIINTLRFLGVIDQAGSRIDGAHSVFVLPNDEFQSGLAKLIRTAYEGLFDLHSDAAWELSKPKLLAFFRTEDKSSELVGNRQSETFIRLAELAGQRAAASASNSGEAQKKALPKSAVKAPPGTKGGKTPRAVAPKNPPVGPPPSPPSELLTAVSLAVKVEVNLPITDDQSVYDAIFKSIRINLIDRE